MGQKVNPISNRLGIIIDEIQVTKQKDSDGEKVVAATMTLHFARAVSHEQIIEEFGKQEGVLFILEV